MDIAEARSPFLGDVRDQCTAKAAHDLRHWRPNRSIGHALGTSLTTVPVTDAGRIDLDSPRLLAPQREGDFVYDVRTVALGSYAPWSA